MKKLLLLILVIILLCFVPTITYDHELDTGVVVVEHKSVVKWVWEKHIEIQKKDIENEKTM